MRSAPLACLLATMTALPAAQGEDSPRRRVIEQKAALVQRVLADSAVAKRIAAGGSDEARAQLARAAEAHRRGLALAAQGQLEAGEAAIDEAMAAIGRARKYAPDRAQAEAELRARYGAQLESTEAMLAATRRQAGDRAGEAAAQIEQGAGLVASAKTLAATSRLDEALQALLAAERVLLAALARVLGTTTLDYTVRFDSPAEELRYETERFGSFQRLVPIALAELKPAPGALRVLEQCVQRATHLRDSAGAQSARGEVRAALDAMREAIVWLQRGLSAAGLVVPAQ